MISSKNCDPKNVSRSFYFIPSFPLLISLNKGPIEKDLAYSKKTTILNRLLAVLKNVNDINMYVYTSLLNL